MGPMVPKEMKYNLHYVNMFVYWTAYWKTAQTKIAIVI